MQTTGTAAAPAPEEPSGGAGGTSVELAPRVERALVVLAAHAQQLDGRLEHIERRLEAVADAQIDVATQDDLLEVRLHSAKLSAELTRMTVELRGEIEDAAHLAATAAANSGTPVTARDRRVATLAEQIIDLSDAFDTGPADIDHHGSPTGWAATG